MSLRSFFVDHPRRAGESYWQHMATALGFACSLFGAALAAAVHSLFPGFFERTASAMVAKLHERMAANRREQH